MSTERTDSSSQKAAAVYNGNPRGSVYSGNSRLLIGRGARMNAVTERNKKWNFSAEWENSRTTPSAVIEQPVTSPSVVADSLSEMEKTCGYDIVKNETFELLGEISQKKFVRQESLRTVSEELSSRLEVTLPSTILSLINALAPVDEYLQRHCVNVSLLNGLFGSWLGMSKREIDNLVLIGLLHDCGKALIPHRVLTAPRKLSIVEFEVIKMHASNSYDLLTEFPEPLRCAARSHHERISGLGYPDGLSYDEIPVEARITAISDIYDAMVSQRAYKTPRSPFNILATLNELRDSELDARLVDVFVSHMPLELLDKPVRLSDGSVGVIRSFDPDDPEYPVVEVNDHVTKTNEDFHCTSMYIEE